MAASDPAPASLPGDCFDILNLPPRPWVDEESARQVFLERSKACHPDRFHQADDATRAEAHATHLQLNEAWSQFSQPRRRLACLIQRYTGVVPRRVAQPPQDLMNLFMGISPVMNRADALARRLQESTSALEKALATAEALEIQEALQPAADQLGQRESALIQNIQDLDATWEDPPTPENLETLQGLYTALSYVSKWRGQVDEKWNALMP